MMVDIEINLMGSMEGLTIKWFDGVCVGTDGGNFMWINSGYTASIIAEELKR